MENKFEKAQFISKLMLEATNAEKENNDFWDASYL